MRKWYIILPGMVTIEYHTANTPFNPSWVCVWEKKHADTDLQCWRSVVEPEMYLGCLGPVRYGARARWHSMLTRRLSHWWYFYRVRVSIGVWGALVWGLADRGAVCTRRDRSTVVACAKLRYDRWGTFWTGARQILIGFRVRSGYRCWDGRQSCEICTSTSVLMTKIFFHFVFVLYLCCSLVVLCHVTLAINCTKLNFTTPDQIYPTLFISKGCEIRINVSNFILWFCYLRVTYLTCYGYIWW